MTDINILEKIIREAGDIALKYFGSVTREEKAVGNLVTVADREIEKFLKIELSKLYPEDGFYGEEEGRQAGKNDRLWIIDPIDGTADYANKLPSWGISVALYEKDTAVLAIVYLPIIGRFFHAYKGKGSFCNGKQLKVKTSDFNSGYFFAANASTHLYYNWNLDLRVCSFPSAVSPCLVADGTVVGSLMLFGYIWDFAACHLIATEAGALFKYISGKVFLPQTLLDGSDIKEPVVCGTQEFIDYIKPNIQAKA